MKKRLLGLLFALALMLSFNVTAFTKCACGGSVGGGCGEEPWRAFISSVYEAKYESLTTRVCACGGGGSGCGDDPVKASFSFAYEVEHENAAALICACGVGAGGGCGDEPWR